MVSQVLKLLRKEISGIHEAAYLLGVFSLLSLILGLIRDRLLAGTFGASSILDAYYSAFKIPDTIFISVASLVSASVLVPFLISRYEHKKDVQNFVNSIFSVFGLIIIIFCLIVFIFAKDITGFLFQGFDEKTLALTVSLTKIMLIQPIFLGLSGFLSSIIQSRQRFFSYALAPVLYNGGIIVGVVFLYPSYGTVGLALGVVLGAISHFLIQIPSFIGLHIFPRPVFKINFNDVFEVFKISLPRTLTLSASSIAMLGLLAIGSKIGEGSVSVFNFGFNIQSAPLSVIVASYSMATFPTLSRFFVKGDLDRFLSLISNTFKHIVFWITPATILLIVLRAQIVRSILGFGEFDWTDTRLTAAILAIFSISILAQSLVVILVRAYYASGNTKVPLLVNVCSAIMVFVFAYVFKFMIANFPFFEVFLKELLRLSDINNILVLSLPLGFSIAMILNACILLLIFKFRFKDLHIETGRLVREHLGASLLGGGVSYLVLNILSGFLPNDKVWGVFTAGLIAGLLGLLAIAFILALMKNQEFKEFLNNINIKIFKSTPVGADQPEG